MMKSNLNNSFSVDDIHKVREAIYEKTKHLTKEEFIKYINDTADIVRKEIKNHKKEKLIM